MKIYELLIWIVKVVCGLSRKVQQHDPDLARQMRRACTSVPLNAVEGWHSHGGNRVARFHTLMGSARETIACLDVAVAIGYLKEAEVNQVRDQLDHVVAAMWRLSRARK